MITITVVVVLCILLAFLVYLSYRNQQVYLFRKQVAKEKGIEFRETQNYFIMVLKFWRRLDSFYKEH